MKSIVTLAAGMALVLSAPGVAGAQDAPERTPEAPASPEAPEAPSTPAAPEAPDAGPSEDEAPDPEAVGGSAQDVLRHVACPPLDNVADGEEQFENDPGGCGDYPGADSLEDPKTYLCNVSGAISDALAANGGGELAKVIDGQRAENGCVETTTTTQASPTTTVHPDPKDPDPDDPGDPGDVDDEVRSANAGADGGLPRTGGSLALGGAGLGLAGLGAVVRRFLR